MTKTSRNSKKKENKLTSKDLQTAVLKLLQTHPDKRFSTRHIIERLGIDNNRDSVQHAINQLYESGKLDNLKRKSATERAENGLSEGENLVENTDLQAATTDNSEKKQFTRHSEFRKPKHEGKELSERFEKRPPRDFSEKRERTDSSVSKKTDSSVRSKQERDQMSRDRNPNRKSLRDKPQRGTYEGIVDVTRNGSAYVVSPELTTDVFVPQKLLNGALNGDRVKISAFFPAGGRRKPDGEVIKILERATDHFIGTFNQTRKYAIVMPDNVGMPDIFVKHDFTKDAEDGDKVVVKITDWQGGKKYWGEVTLVLGAAGSSDIEMKSILISNGFNIEFPENVLAETAQIKDDTESAAEIAKRRDFRDVTTFTIDPFDAKDFDDALSFKVLENGNIEIGVHIADVAHYVLPNSALDKEAYLRSTSVYLVDRVCPMLPERLSNELCSLRPNEDKLTFSAVFEFNDKHQIVSRWFGRTVIHSDRRFSYEEAQTILETGVGDYADELLKLNIIAHHLRKKRFKDGAINFESDEVKFKLDENGVPIEVFIKTRKDSNMLIEDFMLLANREVAAFMAHRNSLGERKANTAIKQIKNDPSVSEVPFVYRTHDSPDLDKLADFAAFARELGVQMKLDTPKNIAKSLNDLAAKAEKDETLKLLTPIAIRCMAKATYTTNNIGHYGLAFDFYSHFTSPIRRYSDVLAHRVLADNLLNIKRYDKETLEMQCNHISKQERKAADAERQSIKYKQVEYMKQHIGEIFDGAVSGMLERGIFVELKLMLAEGMADFGRCPEPFEVEPSRLRARGVRSGRIIRMGQPVKVQIVDADLETRRIDLRLVSY
jgi:ribonuclease R